MSSTGRTQDLYAQLDAALERIPTTSAHWRVFLLVAAGSLFNVIEQYNAGYASPVLREVWDLSATAVSALSTVTFIAMAVGSWLTGYLADRFGRKHLFMINVALYTAGSLAAALAPNYVVLLIARIIIGLGLGGEIGLGYTVIAEIMKAKVRGAMTSGLAFVASGGGVFAASGLATLILGPLSEPLGGQDVAWRWLFGIMVIPALFIMLFRRFIPETPRYLLRRGRIDEVNEILSLLDAGKLRSDDGVQHREWISNPKEVANRLTEEESGFVELFGKVFRRRTIVAWALTIAQFGGFATFAIFTPALFEARGISADSSLFFATVANFAGLVGSGFGVLAAQFLARRLVYTLGGSLMIVAITLLAVVPTAGMTLVVAASMQFVLQVVNATNWCYLPELFPTRVRAAGAGSAATVGMLASGIGPLAAGMLLDASGIGAVLCLLAGFMSLLVVASRFGPETQGAELIEEPASFEDPTEDVLPGRSPRG